MTGTIGGLIKLLTPRWPWEPVLVCLNPFGSCFFKEMPPLYRPDGCDIGTHLLSPMQRPKKSICWTLQLLRSTRAACVGDMLLILITCLRSLDLTHGSPACKRKGSNMRNRIQSSHVCRCSEGSNAKRTWRSEPVQKGKRWKLALPQQPQYIFAYLAPYPNYKTGV